MGLHPNFMLRSCCEDSSAASSSEWRSDVCCELAGGGPRRDSFSILCFKCCPFSILCFNCCLMVSLGAPGYGQMSEERGRLDDLAACAVLLAAAGGLLFGVCLPASRGGIVTGSVRGMEEFSGKAAVLANAAVLPHRSLNLSAQSCKPCPSGADKGRTGPGALRISFARPGKSASDVVLRDGPLCRAFDCPPARRPQTGF